MGAALATVETPAPAEKNGRRKAASKTQIAEMRRLLDAVLNSPDSGSKALAEATSKRTWLKRGIEAVQDSGWMLDQCPASEKPFFEFFDTLHTLMRERMLALGENRSRGDYRVYQSDLERLWRDEYGKFDPKDTAGMTVVIVERPPRG